MKKGIFLFMLAFLSAYSSYAQMNDGLFGNEWINYQQSYYKMKVTQDGLYRVTRQALQVSGVNLSNLNANNVQIFHQGREIPAFVQLNGGTVEYIEFYGQKNRGEMDVNLYAKQSHHFNPEYSVITDTAAYFLTWNNSVNGRRYAASTANLLNPPAKENYFLHRSMAMPATIWQAGKEHNISGELISKSSFEFGEGWGGNKTTNQTIQVAVPNVYAAGPAATGRVRMYSDGNITHNILFKVNNTIIANSTFFGDSVGTHRLNFPLNLLSGNNAAINIIGQNGPNDKQSVSYAEIEYPHTFDFGNNSSFRFKIEASSSRKLLEISNFNNPSGAQNIYLYDMTNGLRIHCFWDGSRVFTDLPPSATERELLLVNLDVATAYHIMGRVEAVQFNNYASINGNFVIITHPNMYTDGQGNNPVLQYAAYRSSTGFNSVVVNVQELFDQFGYGINMHPQALRNFAAYIKQHWDAPEYIFLVGKGRVYNTVRNFNTYDHLIPTFGYPASDNLLVARGGSNVPLVSVGRLAVTNGTELSAYLQKIKDVEALQNGAQSAANKGWMKNIAHLGGGINEMEQNAFGNILNNLKSSVSAGNFGAQVHSFFKKVQEPSTAGNSTRLDSLINSGVSMITYLGHSTINSFDFDAYSLQKYNNYQKYPLFLSLSCSNGGVFGENKMMSENFVLSPNSGSAAFIGFIAPVSLSSANYFSTEFYRLMANEGYGKGAGELTKLSLEHLASFAQYSIVAEMAAQFLVYHGDPAFKIQVGNGADYVIEPASIRIEPATVTAQMESFDLSFDLYNLGKAVDARLHIALYRKLPNGDSVLVSIREIDAPLNQEKISFQVPVGGIPAAGLNRFFFDVDITKQVAESPNPMGENNNTASFAMQIIHSEVKPVFPAEFAMVPTTDITLMASTGNAFAPVQTYIIEIDTTTAFDSPLMLSTQVTQGGGLLSWNPGISYLDSTVYYWRVRSVESITLGIATPDWATSSFMYKAGETGWNQSHIYQFKKDAFHSVTLNETERKFDYIASAQEISLTNAYTPNVLAPGYVANFFNGNLTDKCRCEGERGVYVQVINPNDFSIWTMPGNSTVYGAKNCDPANRPAKMFLFETDQPLGYAALENFLRDTVPADFYVLVYTLNNAYANNWPNSLLSLFENKGSEQVRNLASRANGAPWAFFYKNGQPDYTNASEVLGATENEIIHLSCVMTDSWYKGAVTSTIIGPAKGWDFLDWIQFSTDNTTPTSDIGTLDVFGIDNQGTSTKLFTNVVSADTCLAVIDALEYPFLQLVWNNSDSINKTAPQLDFWRVSAEFLPELALRPDMYQMGHKDTLRRGEMFNFAVMMQNISEIDMDSVLIKFQLVGSNKSIYHRIATLEAGDTMRSPVFSLSTETMNGPQQVLVEINPDNDQGEMYHFNNIALVDFYVYQGELSHNGAVTTNPDAIRHTIPNAPIDATMKIAFDGKKIQNGDLVSATPEITIDIEMNNTTEAVKDLSDLNIYLSHPEMPTGRMLLTSTNPLVQNIAFQAGSNGSSHHAKVVIKLNLPWDDTYNFSVHSDRVVELPKYKVEFDVTVENNPIVINANYPNPFKTETRFMFTLEEGLVAESVKIQITDLSGKLLRELSATELGALQTGFNQPSFAWDATDFSGIALPAGTYFYHITAQDTTGTTKSVASTGKMVLTN